MIRKIIDVYKHNSRTKHRRRQQLCRRFIFYTEFLFKIGVSTYFVAILAFFLYPIYMYFIHDELAPIAPVFLPGIDETTGWGYIVLVFFHTVEMYGAFFGTAGSDLLFAMLIINMPIMARIFSDNVDEFNEFIHEKAYDRLRMKMLFRNILLQHKEIIEYLRII